MPSKELINNTLNAYDKKRALEDRLKEVTKEYEDLSQQLIEEMIDDGIGSINATGESEEGGTYPRASMRISRRSFASVEDTDKLYPLLDKLGMADMRKPNAATLSSWLDKEAPPNVQESPEEFGIKVYEKRMLTVRRNHG